MCSEKFEKMANFCDQVFANELTLLNAHGAIIGGHDLPRILGYPSSSAFRQAVHRKSVPIPTFKQPGFRMRFARTHDIAIWLALMGREIKDLIPDDDCLAVTQANDANKFD